MHVRRHSGFSLLELLLVVIILAVLAAIVVPAMFNSSEDAKVVASQSVVKLVQKRIEMAYYKDGKWPDNIQQEWFSSVPKNPLAPDHHRTIFDDVDGGNNPNKWHPSGKTTSQFPFWYNKHNGAFRIRVPAQASNGETLELYHRSNMTE